MSYPNPSTAFAAVIVEELVRSGITLFVAAPGSRSTALVLAVSAHPDASVAMAIDERSAGFHALGWAKASRAPTAIITTSGTAVANLMPAVVEADMAGIPLLVLSADRPPELRGVGANQSIEQAGLFGSHVRLSLDLGPPEVRPDASRFWRSAVSQALAAGRGFGGRPGPVHLNLAFREPTVPVTYDGRSREEPYPPPEPGRADGREWTETARGRHPSPEVVDRLATAVARSRRGMIVAGAGTEGARPVADLGAHLGWPVVATAESGLRGLEGTVATGHHLVGRARPDLVVRFGAPGPSRHMAELVSAPVAQAVISSTWSDPGRTADLLVDADPEAVARALLEAVPTRPLDEWAKWWQEADNAVQSVLAPELEGEVTEPAMAAAAGNAGADLLAVASSMPIRDVESYAFTTPRLVANRGASGIDGFVSTALGAARTVGRPLALTGDLSLLHDANGFLMQPRPDCVFVVVDNAGGGIFSFLPQAEHVGEEFVRLFATPSGVDLGRLADLHGMEVEWVEDIAALRTGIEAGWEAGGCRLVIGRTDRDDNVAEHARLNRLAAEAVASVPSPLE